MNAAKSIPRIETVHRCTVRVTTANGESWITSINLPLEEAESYYMGHRFEALNPYTQKEYMRAPVTKVEYVGKCVDSTDKTLNEVLSELGYTTSPGTSPTGYTKVIKRDGYPVFEGCAAKAWGFLRANGEIK
jgi:hypothetical protein